jgi:predicted proteasome-type protease
VIVMLSSGNLAMTQGAVNVLDRHRAPEGTR